MEVSTAPDAKIIVVALTQYLQMPVAFTPTSGGEKGLGALVRIGKVSEVAAKASSSQARSSRSSSISARSLKVISRSKALVIVRGPSAD